MTKNPPGFAMRRSRLVGGIGGIGGTSIGSYAGARTHAGARTDAGWKGWKYPRNPRNPRKTGARVEPVSSGNQGGRSA